MDKKISEIIFYMKIKIFWFVTNGRACSSEVRGFGSMDMESLLKNYIAQKVPGKMPYLGIIHRWISRWRGFLYLP